MCRFDFSFCILNANFTWIDNLVLLRKITQRFRRSKVFPIFRIIIGSYYLGGGASQDLDDHLLIYLIWLLPTMRHSWKVGFRVIKFQVRFNSPLIVLISQYLPCIIKYLNFTFSPRYCCGGSEGC